MATQINGKFWSYANLEISIARDGNAREIIAEIPTINYPQALERERVWGTGQYPLGSTSPRSPIGEGNIEMYAERYRQFIAAIGDGYGNIDLNILVKMREGQGQLFTDDLTCLINGDENSHSQGASALMVSIPMFYTQIKLNGVSIL